MRKMNLPEPEFIEERGIFKVIFRNNFNDNSEQVEGGSEQVSEQVNVDLKLYRELVLKYCYEAKSAKQIREYLNLKSRNYVNYNIIKPLISDGLLEYTNKINIRASNQKYVSKK